MGQLVFQATLGGQVNLVGPNTASTYNINVPAVAGNMVTTGDTGTVTNTMCATSVYTAPGTIGSGTPNTGAFTTLSASGNVTFSGAGAKIAGDFTNATLTNRAAFQTTTTNGTTGIYALPNGTSTAASWQATNNSDPTNASKILIATNGSTDCQLVSGRNGTGTYLPLTFYTNGSEQMRLDTSGNVGIGTSSPVSPLSIYKAGTQVGATTAYTVANFEDATPNKGVSLGYDSGSQTGVIIANTNSASSNLAFWTYQSGGTGWAERARIDSSGNLLVGYTSSNGSYKLQVNSQIFATSSTIATSDVKYKENIVALDDALSLVSALNPVQFSWKEHPIHNFDRTQPTIGFIAQEVQQVLANKPYLNSIVKRNECVISEEEKDENGNVTKPAVTEEFLGIAEGNMIALLTKSIQEQQAIIEQMKADIAALKPQAAQ